MQKKKGRPLALPSSASASSTCRERRTRTGSGRAANCEPGSVELGPQSPPLGGSSGPPPLPCQKSSNCTGGARVAAHYRKAAAALSLNVGHLAKVYGLHRLGFLTLTFRDHVLEPREAQRRLHSLITHVIDKRYSAWLRVFERQKSGRIHYHLLVVVDADIRAGVDFDAFKRRDYRSASEALRTEWAFWRRTAPRYRFGRTELLPVYSTIDAMASYVGKYIGKHVEARQERDKGVRLVAYSKGARMASSRFAWAEQGRAWRKGCAAFSEALERTRGLPQGYVSRHGVAAVLGRHWSHQWRDVILSLGAVALEAEGEANRAEAEAGGGTVCITS